MTHTQLLTLSQKHPIVVFDGVCVLCNGFIQWVITKDRDQVIRFISLQQVAGLGDVETKMDTVLLYKNGIIYNKSDVSMQVVSLLHRPYSWLRIFKWVPRIIRDTIYDVIASNRYRWFGKKDQCMIPTEQQKELFIA